MNGVIVALEHNAHDVFPDVVDVPFHGRQHHRAPCLLFRGTVVHVRFEPCHGFFHDTGALHHLGKEHFSGPKEVTDHVHAVHQRPFDDGQRIAVQRERSLYISFDVLRDAVDQGVPQPFVDAEVAPRLRLHHGGCVGGEIRSVRHQVFCGFRMAVEQDVFDQGEKGGVNVLVQCQMRRVHDAHGQAGFDGMMEERSVHGLSNRVVASEGEGQVADATADHRGWACGSNASGRLDEIDGEGVVLLHARRYSEHVRVVHDVGWVETHHIHEELLRTQGNLDLAFHRFRLALLIETHHDDGSPVPVDGLRLLKEHRFTFLEGNGIHHRFALDALETCFEHAPL